jgi:hypothetical protein
VLSGDAAERDVPAVDGRGNAGRRVASVPHDVTVFRDLPLGTEERNLDGARAAVRDRDVPNDLELVKLDTPGNGRAKRGSVSTSAGYFPSLLGGESERGMPARSAH